MNHTVTIRVHYPPTDGTLALRTSADWDRWQWPDVFGNAGCLSSTFGYRDDLHERIEAEPKRSIKVYLDSGWPGDNYWAMRAHVPFQFFFGQ